VQVQLIDDLLDVSRIITGKLRVETRPVHLRRVIEAAIESVQTAAMARAIRIETDFDRQSYAVAGDPDRLQQVVWNLLSNALKFTPEGGSVSVHLEHTASHARVTVRDTGQGIPSEFLPFVFDRFRQADGSNTRSHGGLGLGLAIVRHLVELHGGTVRAESPGLGMGTSMHVELPLTQAQIVGRTSGENVFDIRQGRKRDRILSGVHVLVVDDDLDTLDLLNAVLGASGATVTKARCALDALRAIDKCRPDVLISDISMPGTNGYELIRIVRALPAEKGGTLPAASLTALARDEDRAEALEAGFQTHISKPIIPDELIAVVANLSGISLDEDAPSNFVLAG
jgi:CheY-like chemotaxis protein/two-component sensor histidine kinase